jgi:hypothetical protein
VKALGDRMDLGSTEDLGAGDLEDELHLEWLADLSEDAPFKAVPPGGSG